MKKVAVGVVAFLLLGFFGLLIVLSGFASTVGGLTGAQQSQSSCGTAGDVVTVSANGLPTEVRVGRAVYRGPQLVGAAAIIRAGADARVGVRGQTIGVMTSIGESTLTAVQHGDAVGPDSLGWFQQRDPWGPREVRLDAYGSATMFFAGGRGGQKGLLDQPGWETLPPTIAAHRVQINADPYHYEKFWDDAVAIVGALVGADVSVQPGAGGQVCVDEAASAAPVTAGGWARPTTGPVTSEFGMRWGAMHNGLDFGAACGTPVHAAAGGTVVLVVLNNRPPATGYGTLIAVDHGGGLVTRYAHAFPQDVLVRVGDVVTGGQQIAEVGNYGNSTGCHLHFEVQTNGRFVDPKPFLAERNVAL